jgi:Hemerythrin HHE cation binding domain
MPNRIEKTMSEAMGAAKDIKARVKGLKGVFRHLMEEHGKVGALIKRVSMSSDEKVRAELFPTIRTELLGHESGELMALYPALAEYPETSYIADEHAKQAGEMERAIAELDELSFSDAGWGPAFDRLATLVEQHVTQEESDYFPKAQKVIGEERAEQLLPAFEAAKKRAEKI